MDGDAGSRTKPSMLSSSPKKEPASESTSSMGMAAGTLSKKQEKSIIIGSLLSWTLSESSDSSKVSLQFIPIRCSLSSSSSADGERGYGVMAPPDSSISLISSSDLIGLARATLGGDMIVSSLGIRKMDLFRDCWAMVGSSQLSLERFNCSIGRNTLVVLDGDPGFIVNERIGCNGMMDANMVVEWYVSVAGLKLWDHCCGCCETVAFLARPE